MNLRIFGVQLIPVSRNAVIMTMRVTLEELGYEQPKRR